MTGENGLREALATLRREADRLWEHKASKTELMHVRENLSEFKQSVSADIREIRTSIEKVEELIASRQEARVREKKAAIRERKTDRRWLIGAVFTAASLIIAAMAILIPLLTNPPS